MRISTKRNLLRAATTLAVVCTAAVVFLPAGAYAAPAQATANLRVHDRPSLSSRVVDTLRVGETVDVGGCRRGWCYIEHRGRDGFVSADYLSRGGARIDPNFNLSFNFPQGSFSIGTGGVTIGIGGQNDDRGPGRDDHGGPGRDDHGGPGRDDHGGPGRDDHSGRGPDRGPGPGGVARDTACFYTESDYRGARICVDAGDSMNMPRSFNNAISSIRLGSGARAMVCDGTNLRTGCRTYTTSARSLGAFDNKISSVRVR